MSVEGPVGRRLAGNEGYGAIAVGQLSAHRQENRPLSDPVGRGASNGQEEAGRALGRTNEAPGRSLGGGVPRGRLELPTARFSVVSSTN